VKKEGRGRIETREEGDKSKSDDGIEEEMMG
jgi:hypothetical protein